MINRQATIDTRRYTFGNDEFNLENAYHDCKLVFDRITDDDSFQKADTGLILYYANEIIYALHKALESKGINILSNDCINRRGAIDALWKSLYEYEDKTEKQFLESKELDVADWFKHRIFVQNMSDIDRQTILNLPPAQSEPRWIPCSERLPEEEKKTYWVCTDTEYQCECQWTNNRFGIGEGEWGWSIFDTPQYSKPIAWMPLPEPYKEGDN